jgi:hypothetical protein
MADLIRAPYGKKALLIGPANPDQPAGRPARLWPPNPFWFFEVLCVCFTQQKNKNSFFFNHIMALLNPVQKKGQ